MAHIKRRKSLTRQTLIRPGYEILKYRTEGTIGYRTIVTDKICTASLHWEYCVLLWRRLTFLGFKDAHMHIHAHARAHTCSRCHTLEHTPTYPHRSTLMFLHTLLLHVRTHTLTLTLAQQYHHTRSHYRGSVSSHFHELEVNKALRIDVAPTNNIIQGVSRFVYFTVDDFPRLCDTKKLPIDLYPIPRNA
jgi:hypothetical protein